MKTEKQKVQTLAEHLGMLVDVTYIQARGERRKLACIGVYEVTYNGSCFMREKVGRIDGASFPRGHNESTSGLWKRVRHYLENLQRLAERLNNET